MKRTILKMMDLLFDSFIKGNKLYLIIKYRYFANNNDHLKTTISYMKNKVVKRDGYIIDIGAANGDSTLLFAKEFPNFSVIGFEHIILCPYSNAYNGYITTFEEYQVQDYEAGHCVFGQWSLNALQQVTHQLCNELIKKHEDRNIPFLQEAPISEKYLERFAYEKSYYYKKLEKKLNKKENFIVEKAKKYYHKLDKKNDSNI